MKTNKLTKTQQDIVSRLLVGDKVQQIGSAGKWWLFFAYTYAGRRCFCNSGRTVRASTVNVLVSAGLCTVTAEDELVLTEGANNG